MRVGRTDVFRLCCHRWGIDVFKILLPWKGNSRCRYHSWIG